MSKRVYEPKTCAVCGMEFTPRHGRQKYCSDECYLKANRRQATDRYWIQGTGDVRIIRFKRCLECGAQFETASTQKKFCCKKCRTKYSSREQYRKTLGVKTSGTEADKPVSMPVRRNRYICTKACDCVYGIVFDSGHACDYIGHTGHSRGCWPDECTHFRSKKGDS